MPQRSVVPVSEVAHTAETGSDGVPRLDRRTAIAALATAAVAGLAGCTTGSSYSDADVVAGPDRDLVFEPATLTITAGETVRWGFESAGHNVCCRPDDHDVVDLPPDAQAFASYGTDEDPKGSLVPRGDTYEHTFEVPGAYEYVCIPHAPQGMTGTIRVE